jgi:gamma-glutamylcyclotransferase (GGCT)/AIG2-like uncharacterized protein YtfP
MTNKTALFVYGSLIDPACRERILGRVVETMAAILHGYERGRGRYYFIRPRAGLNTRGLLLLQLTSADFVALDRYEEIPRLYTREMTEVVDLNGQRSRCWVYLPTPYTMGGGE